MIPLTFLAGHLLVMVFPAIFFHSSYSMWRFEASLQIFLVIYWNMIEMQKKISGILWDVSISFVCVIVGFDAHHRGTAAPGSI